MNFSDAVDLLIIGAGSAGVRAARLAAVLGKRVAIVEQHAVGGTCVNVGCVPKKLFSYAAHWSEDIQLAEGFGWDVQAKGFSWQRLRDNKNSEIQRLNEIYQNLLQKAGVTLWRGSASFVDAHRVAVAGRIIRAENILIATGGRPVRPLIPGVEHALVSDEVFFLSRLPEKIIIAGGGYIAVEFAAIFHGLGVDTELDYRGPLFLNGFDEEIRRFLAEEMRKKGMVLRFNSQIQAIEKLDSGQKRVHYHDGQSRVCDEVLLALGREPNTQNLCLENTRVETTARGAIKVSDNFQTQEPSIYALGDVINRVQLTPVALAEAQVFVDQLYGSKQLQMHYELIPTAVFCHPNVAVVGLSEEQARQRYKNVGVYRSRFRPMKYSLSASTAKVLMKMLVNAETDQVLGVHMVGEQAAEIIQGMAVALKAGASKAMFDATLGIHPSLAEEFVTMRLPS